MISQKFNYIEKVFRKPVDSWRALEVRSALLAPVPVVPDEPGASEAQTAELLLQLTLDLIRTDTSSAFDDESGQSRQECTHIDGAIKDGVRGAVHGATFAASSRLDSIGLDFSAMIMNMFMFFLNEKQDFIRCGEATKLHNLLEAICQELLYKADVCENQGEKHETFKTTMSLYHQRAFKLMEEIEHFSPVSLLPWVTQLFIPMNLASVLKRCTQCESKVFCVCSIQASFFFLCLACSTFVEVWCVCIDEISLV